MEEKAPQQSEHFPDCFYRVTVKGLLVQDGKLLMTSDFMGEAAKAKGGEWEMPGGGLDFGENPREALVREIKEEMGLTVTWVAEEPLYIWTHKKLNSRGMEWYHILALGYQFTVEHLDFTRTEECEAIEFFSKEDLFNLREQDKLGQQIIPFVDIFDPEDFETI